MTPFMQSGTFPVTGNDGLRGTFTLSPGDPTPESVAVRLADGRQVTVPTTLLQRRSDDTYYLPLGPSAVAAADGVDATTVQATTGAAMTGEARSVVPLVAEQLEIHKRRVETGRVRVTKSVEHEERVVDVSLEREEVTVERVPVERFVTEPPAVRHEGDVTIIPVMEEVLVVEKRLMLREELRLTVHRSQTHEPRTVTLRKEVAHVERVPAEGPVKIP